MTETTTTPVRRQPKPDRVRRVADDIVTPNSLATSRHDAAERGAADGGSGDRATQ